MLHAEPAPTQGDLHFSVFGIRVRVHPFFWLVSVMLGLNEPKLLGVGIWVAAVFVAILAHELGHALWMRRLGLEPWIVLHGMGGLACYHPSQLSGSRASGWLQQVLISLAGPGAGFLLAALILVLAVATGHEIGIFFGAPLGLTVWVAGLPSDVLSRFVNCLLQVCVAWGLVNLLPVYPLDGGQVAREILLRINHREGVRRSLVLSTITAALVAAFALAELAQAMQVRTALGGPPTSVFKSASLYVALLFGYLAYASYQALLAQRPGGRRW
ncbi:MAG: site-2 protease family protein [Pirellulales bacterium]|nr:site-2 protease family protein [Pirellulales bacterium]